MTNRDYPTPADERWVKKAALECAEKNALAVDDLDRYEMFLLVGLLSRGLLSLEEFENGWAVEYDGIDDEATGNTYHHVYVYVNGPEERAQLALDITCNQ